ncbi:MAG: Fe2+-dependent dioxygenase [Rhodovibrionaceae bacterium]
MLLKVPQLLEPKEVARLRETLERAQFVDGSVSGKAALKRNLQANQANPEVSAASKACVGRMFQRREVTAYAIPKQIYLIFNRYDVGMEYKDHIDAALMGDSQRPLRADISFTVFLTDAKDYAGGEFVLQTPYGEQRIKHDAGDVMLYPSTMLHRVDPITEGVRWCAVGWIQSFVKDAEQRRLLFEMDRLRYRIAEDLPESSYPEDFGQVHQNLLRMWSEV